LDWIIRKKVIANKRLDWLDVWSIQILYFMLIYTAYVLVAVVCIILVGEVLFLQWIVNNYMHPSVLIGFLICLIGVLFGIVILGVRVWRGGAK